MSVVFADGPEGVLFRDIESLVCAYLRARIPVHVGIRIPTPRASEFIRVMRTGGVKETLISEAAQITVEAWARSEERASYLLSQCRAVLNAADAAIYGVREFSGPANLPDPLSAQLRYTMSFQIRARGTVISA